MKRKHLILVPAAAAALVFAGCSSDDSSTAADSASNTNVDVSEAAPDFRPATCPTDAPAADTKADWTLQGTSGSIDVVGPTDDTAPLVTIEGAPFEVDKTTVETLEAGDGTAVTKDSTVSVCYHGVNGRDGSVFDSAFDRGEPAAFPASGVVPGFQKALMGQKAGADVAVAVAPADGYPQGTPDGAIKTGDTIVFALTIVSVQ
ncbi:FKBP-type peptidyl-prolyl cis-trans isomerase [Gordonia zhaorongruii]|uniref:FKBP-type peptidyl-prolyl cis-trans isomerase n=1 Tax=Gordonia zhaorongruii TaxID=2597659 RepID=UPI001051CFD5|nr:FKBP-type peptidyl-prolyl cis-trans isomerase [Gordonia zhaorongruii]